MSDTSEPSRPGKVQHYPNKPNVPGHEVLSTREILAVMACLRLRRAGKPITVRAVARAMGQAPNSAYQVLRKLERHGLVTCNEGNATRTVNCLFIPAQLRGQPHGDETNP